MGLADAINAEDRVEVKYSDFVRLVKAETERNFLRNAVTAEIPYEFVLKFFTGKNSELEEYRKTELTPEQIREIDRLYADICKEKAILTAERNAMENERDTLREELLKLLTEEGGECATRRKTETNDSAGE